MENNNSTQDHRCIGLHCLVVEDGEITDLFMDHSRMLAGSGSGKFQITPGTMNPEKQNPYCKPNSLQGGGDCLRSPQLMTKGRPCEPKNRAPYPPC